MNLLETPKNISKNEDKLTTKLADKFTTDN